MDKYEIIQKIEDFAPLQTAQPWDCSGWIVETERKDIYKVMLALTPCSSVIKQAKANHCDMIISHHPMFYVPVEFSGIDIYCAHTNLDSANGGTTDALIKSLGLEKFKIAVEHEFLRMIEFKDFVRVEYFAQKLEKISPNLRIINNKNQSLIKKAAFCAGSGSEFISQAKELGADCFVTGDLKFHAAVDSEIIVFDIEHFYSEIGVLSVLEKLIPPKVIVVYAKESSPFVYKKKTG